MREITGRHELAFRSGKGPEARLIVLASALLGEEPEAVRALSLPAWEERLLALRAHVMGPRIEAEFACPGCGAGALLIFNAGDLPREAAAVPEAGIALRPLTAGDVADLQAAGLAGEAALAFLLARAGGMERAEAAAALAGPGRKAILATLEVLAAGLALELGTQCMDCGAPIAAPFDVANFVDAEMTARADRLLDELHVIAITYHWGEGEILDLPVARRQAYLASILGDRALAGRAGAVA